MNEPSVNTIATEWVVRLDKGLVSSQEQIELDQWLAADDRHRGAFIRAKAAWSLLDRARVLPAEEVAAERPRKWWLGATAAAATICLAILLGWQFVGSTDTYTTARHEVRRLVLSDGSVAHLDTETVIRVHMTRGQRQIQLEGGTAWFDVVHDAARPFVVTAGDTDFVAVGTSFAVERGSDDVAILVTKGVVRADTDGSSAVEPVLLPAGSKADVNREGQMTVRQVSMEELERNLSWREGVIVVDGQTLSEAAAQFNRYNQRRLLVRGARIGGIEIVGHFNMNDPESFARAAAPLVGGAVQVKTDSIVISDPKSAEQWVSSEEMTRP